MHVLLLLFAAALPDRGIYPDLDGRIELAVPPMVSRARTWTRVDEAHKLITIYDGSDPIKVYRTPLAESEQAELDKLVAPEAKAVRGAPPRKEDRDGDGIVDRLDIVLGARKLLANGARYIERYVVIPYPGGDVPRTEGVCTDTVIRSLRNAGIDLQREVHEDLVRAPSAYPMVERVDSSINHRRVKTLVRWFERHWRAVEGEAWRPGDVVFFDTFPKRSGPDHLGVVGDRAAASGLPVIINNWTDGTVDAEMDLLSWVPVTHHFRAP